MKTLILSISIILLAMTSWAQINKKDTVKVDSAQVEKINKMPMDSTRQNMPIVPLYPKDTLMNRKSGDDADPKGPNHQSKF